MVFVDTWREPVKYLMLYEGNYVEGPDQFDDTWGENEEFICCLTLMLASGLLRFLFSSSSLTPKNTRYT